MGLALGQLLAAVAIGAAVMFVSPHDAWMTVAILLFAAVVATRAAQLLLGGVVRDVRAIREGLHALERGERDIQIEAELGPRARRSRAHGQPHDRGARRRGARPRHRRRGPPPGDRGGLARPAHPAERAAPAGAGARGRARRPGDGAPLRAHDRRERAHAGDADRRSLRALLPGRRRRRVEHRGRRPHAARRGDDRAGAARPSRPPASRSARSCPPISRPRTRTPTGCGGCC